MTTSSLTVGLLHPGAMGVSVGAALTHCGADVLWASAGRSPATSARATEAGLRDVQHVAALCEASDWILSVCPPHAAEEVAAEVAACGYKGAFCDANAIAPTRMQRIADHLLTAGITVVDGGIVGGPAWHPGTTRLYLSGQRAEDLAAAFARSPLEAISVGEDIGKASALKLSYAAYTKGRGALVTLVGALAKRAGVFDELQAEWAQSIPELESGAQRLASGITRKAWRFAGEMREIADLCAALDLPEGFHQAAAGLFADLADFKGADPLPDPEAVWNAIGSAEAQSRKLV